MYFGPADRDFNLLLAPPELSNSNIPGGHRLWLGPQVTWAKIWPPPKEWELSGPESHTTGGGRLRLLMADAGDGWPRLTRTYQWAGAQLICGAEMHGGTRPAQFIQIFQMSATTLVETAIQPEPAAPHGYVLLPSGPVTQFTTDFPPPLPVTLHGHNLTLRHQPGLILKTGYRPQALTGRDRGFALRVSRGEQTGTVVAEPDRGFFTQVYLGGVEPFIELEQLSPLFSPGGSASFAIGLEGSRP
jgi:hypothetical protein